VATDTTEVRTKPALTDNLADIDEPFADGFNWNTIMAMLFIGIVMMPGAIYLGLVAGQGMGGAAEWVTIILFLEITKRSFITLKRQELILIYWSASMLVSVAGSGLSGGMFAGLIWNQFFVQSPQAEAIATYIPTWYAPAKGSAALFERSFMDAVWIKPILIVVSSTILFQIVSLSLGYVMFRITSDIERLPFPLAPVAAGGATALAETSTKGETWRWRVFSIGTVVGLIWGTIYVVIPTLSGTFLTQAVAILPIPFLDFTVNLRSVLPTAVLAIGTDMSTLLAGFVFPYWTVIGMFIGAMVKNFVVNPVLYNYGVLNRWEPGMSLIPTTIAVEFDYWLSAKIGMAIAVFVISFYAVIRKLVTGKDEISERPTDNLDPDKVGPGSGRGDISIWIALTAWFVCTTSIVFFVKYLVPDFPWWITAFFGFIFTPILSYISAKMTGITGSAAGTSFPYVREGAIYLSGYQGVAIWFAPLPIGDYGGYSSTFRVLQLTRTKFISYIKLILANLLILTLFSFIFWTLIWRMTLIPSSEFPYVQKMWPYFATMQALWASSTLPGGNSLMQDIVTMPKLFSGSVTAVVLYGAVVLLKAPLSLFYGMIGGLTSFPTGVYLLFAGAMLNRFYFYKKFGKETWAKYAPILLAGYGCGMGLVAMSSIAISLVMKSVSQVIF
jgi:hypothetical protein